MKNVPRYSVYHMNVNPSLMLTELGGTTVNRARADLRATELLESLVIFTRWR